MCHTDQNTAQRSLQVEVLGGEKRKQYRLDIPKDENVLY